jgi:hypothetical protein
VSQRTTSKREPGEPHRHDVVASFLRKVEFILMSRGGKAYMDEDFLLSSFSSCRCCVVVVLFLHLTRNKSQCIRPRLAGQMLNHILVFSQLVASNTFIHKMKVERNECAIVVDVVVVMVAEILGVLWRWYQNKY